MSALSGHCHCGASRWSYRGDPGSVTACNCTMCRRYRVLWIYDWHGDRITVTGPLKDNIRADGGALAFRFCPHCGAMVQWRARKPNDAGVHASAGNLRLVEEPDAVMGLPIDHFDGLDRFDDLPRDGRCVRDMWF